MSNTGFIQIGETYFATIFINGVETVLKDEHGKKIPFDSAARARRAAIDFVTPPKPARSRPPDPYHDAPDMVREWNQQRLNDQAETRAMGMLLGVKVEHKGRRKKMATVSSRQE